MLDHIHTHLEQDLDLESLARLACFSRFHFHRIFAALVGEPVHTYIRRLRLERAASLLAHSPRATVLDIALRHGFTSQAAFSRAFREHLGVSPTRWRQAQRKNGITKRKGGLMVRSLRTNPAHAGGYPAGVPENGSPAVTKENPMNIRIENRDPLEVAYARRIGPYAEAAREAWDELCDWTIPRDLMKADSVFLSVSHDDPAVTDPARCRYDACMIVPPEVQAEGTIGRRSIPGGKYAVLRYEGPVDDVGTGWAQLFGEWLPDSGYQPGDHPGYELYVVPPAKAPPHHAVVDLYLPVVPL